MTDPRPSQRPRKPRRSRSAATPAPSLAGDSPQETHPPKLARDDDDTHPPLSFTKEPTGTPSSFLTKHQKSAPPSLVKAPTAVSETELADPRNLEFLTEQERQELDRLLVSDPVKWRPLPGPQSQAFASEATVVGYGGAAGGGKTDLAIGLSITGHRKVGIFRQNGTELTGIVDRMTDILGTRDGYNGTEKIWRFKRHDGVDVQVEFGSFPAPGDVEKYRGRPHDLLIYDEASGMREADVRFIMGWLRSTVSGQRCRVLFTFNPPTSAEGRWVVKYFAPWLDKKHPNPAKPGEIRWFAAMDGKEVEVADGKSFLHSGQEVFPQSRTFIPSRVTDNPYLMTTGYMAQLDSLPEPLRSQMKYGDFNAGIEDDPMQVIPTRWVELAQARWTRSEVLPQMDSLGVDVARGGRDQTIIARRHGMWFNEPLVYPGSQTPDGPTVAGLCVAAVRDFSPIHIDVIGVGASPYDFLMQAQQQVVGVNVSESARGLDKSGRLKFRNLRSELWWRMREALDPNANNGIALPPDSRLLADLCAPTWEMVGQTVSVAGRDEIMSKIGRSPDFASAYVMALMDTPKRFLLDIAFGRKMKDYDPYSSEVMK